MDRLREMLAEIRVPTYQDVRSGEYFRKLLKGPDTVDRGGYLNSLENNLVYLQEVVLWTDLKKSLTWLLLSQIFLYQFCLSNTSIISSTAYTCLLSYLYITWTRRVWPTIKLPSQHKQDAEHWTAVHPDALSAPEMENVLNKIRERIIEIYSGLWLLRREAPLRFCITLSTFFICTGIIGLKVSTPLLIHSVALAVFVIPPAILALSRKEQTQPGLILVGEVICSLSNLLVYHGENYSPKESNDLDDFLPDSSKENLQKLDISSKQPNTESEDLSLLLAPEQSIPSHDEVDLLALANPDMETDLMPCSTIEHDASDLEDEIEAPQGRLRGVEDSDTDSADGAFSLADQRTASLTSYLPAVTSAYLPSVSSVNQVLSGLMTSTTTEVDRDYRSSSEPNLEDFELISEEELDKVSP